MSYSTINQCANDAAFQARLTAAAAQEATARDDRREPGQLMYQLRWPTASASDVEAAYASALASDNPDPGGDETVITDGMLLANVQAHWPPTP